MKDKKLDSSIEDLKKQDNFLFTSPQIEINNNHIEEIEELSTNNLNHTLPKTFQRQQSLPASKRRKSEYLAPGYSLQNDNGSEPTLLKRAWRSMLSVVVPPFEHDIETRRTALEIDRKSRFIFPLAFTIFNIVYWTILIVFSFSNNSF